MDHPVPEENEATARPEWLVGADEGAAAESVRPRPDASSPPIRLVRPQGPPDPAPRRSPGVSGDFGALELTGDPAPETSVAREALPISSLRRATPAEELKAPEKKAWTAAASSVPRLRLVKSAPAPLAGLSLPAANDAPDEDRDPAELDEEASFLDDASSSSPRPAGPSSGGLAPARPPAALREAWWVVAIDAVRTDRRIQLGACAVVAAVIAWVLLQPREDSHISVGSIHQHPDRFDGQTVTVQGRVGEVFPVGGGYAFYLHQGRDTLVVFTRSRRPESRARVTVKGAISTGFLDGLPRQALFEAL